MASRERHLLRCRRVLQRCVMSMLRAVDFVAEDDVRRAIREGRTITIRRGAIVTPAARDLADGKGVLVEER